MHKNIKNIFSDHVSSDMIGKPHLLSKTSLRTTDWGQTFKFLDDTTTKNSPTIGTLENCSKEGIYHVKDILTEGDCKEIISKAMDLNLQYCCYGDERNNSRLVLFDKDFSQFIWEKVCTIFTKALDDDNLVPFGFDVSRGKWELCGVNEAMRLNRYRGSSEDFFGPHRDAPFCPNGDKRSLFTMLIYLNDDFEGGDTKFHFPRNPTIDTKGLTVDEEIEKHGDLENGFESFYFMPKMGHAVIFKQNILHEGYPLLWSSKYKYVIKTDIMVKRVGEKYGFSLTKKEEGDYFECLQLFRQAQQYELKVETTEKTKANECYEKSLSIRYCYPQLLKEKPSTASPIPSQTTGTQVTDNLPDSGSPDADLSQSQPVSIFSSQDTSFSAFKVFPKEVWYMIMMYAMDKKSLNNLCEVFPELLVEKRRLFLQFVVPKVKRQSGVYTMFNFQNTNFLINNLKSCVRVVAVYSLFLLGNSPESSDYLVSYDKESRNAKAVNLSDLLMGVFNKEPCYGTIFKVKQQNETKNPATDMYHSVDRQFMATHFDRDDFGIDLESEFRTPITIRSNLSELNDCFEQLPHFILHTDFSKELQDRYNKRMFGSWDRHHQGFETIMEEYLDNDDENLRENLDDYEFDNEETHATYQSLLAREICRHIPAATVVRKSLRKISIDSDDICNCFFPLTTEGNITDNCTSYFFNHLVVDFSTTELNVKKGMPSDWMVERFQKWVEIDYPTDMFEHFNSSVSIEELEKSIPSFNHAACQCSFPNYDIEDYVNLSSYPLLKEIHVVVVRNKIDENECYVFTCYGGIVVL